MKGVIAFAIAVLATHTIAMAADKKALCYTNHGLDNARLACVTCGVQDFMEKKGIKGYPSERWIALLATTNRAYLDSKGEGIETNFDVRYRMQKTLAMQLQTFGFCTRFDGSRGGNDKRNVDAGFRDMTPGQWIKLNKLLTDATPANKDQMEEFAAGYGFSSDGDDKAAKNLKILLYNDNSKSKSESTAQSRAEHLSNLEAWRQKPLFQRRAEFRDRLERALKKDSVVEDANLRGCLNEILVGLEGGGPAKAFKEDPDSYALCQAIHNSCKEEAGDGPDFGSDGYCYAPGMTLKKAPVATPQPKPVSTEPYKPGKAGSSSQPSTLPAPPPLPDPEFQQR